MPEPREIWSIQVHKDYLKFSAAHFLIFPDGTAERLHGHNYKVFVSVETPLDGHGLVVNFSEIKPIIRALADSLDEHFLVPGQHPVLSCEEKDGGLYEIRYQERLYLIPKEDVIVMPITNTSAENLAAWFGRELIARVEQRWPDRKIQRLEVGVEETPGQRGVYTRLL